MSAIADPKSYVEGMRLFPAAVNLICTGEGDTRVGFTATAVMSLTAEPAQLALAVGRNVTAFDQIVGSDGFTINTLAADQIEMAGNFAGRLKEAERFTVGNWTDTPHGPRLEDALLTFECAIHDRVELSTHCLLLAEVRRVHRNPHLHPLLYVDGDWAGLQPLGGMEVEEFLVPVQESIAAIERAAALDQDYASRLATFVQDFTDVYIGRQSESRDYFSVELYVREEHLSRINEMKRTFDHQLMSLLEDGRRAGVFHFDDARVTALAITGMIGWTYRWYRPGGRISRQELGAHFARLTLRMLGAELDAPADARGEDT